jgi:uncharacterized DUF497 family protein
MATTVWISHAERYERRRAIIAELGKQTTQEQIAEIAKRHRLSTNYVTKCVRDEGVRIISCRPATTKASTYTIVAALLRGESQSEIAERHGVSRQRIHQIHTAMQVHGVYLAGKE